MTLQITIIGMGQIGTSLGLALEEFSEDLIRVGHDKSRSIANQAKGEGAVDRVAITLSGSVKNADIVILALPIQEVRAVLEHIALDLKEEVLVIDTAPLKTPVLDWVDQFLPEHTSYVGLMPVINSAYLEDPGYGVDAARADMFEGCLMGLITGSRTDQKAVKMASQIIELVGADPFFIDPAELDGVMSRVHVLPRVLASSLLGISMGSPGWREGQKLAGKAFTSVTHPLTADDEPGALAAMAVHNQANTVRVVNELIRELMELRDQVEKGQEDALQEKFQFQQRKRDLWRQDREEGAWSDQKSSPELEQRSMLGDLFGFRKPKPPEED